MMASLKEDQLLRMGWVGGLGWIGMRWSSGNGTGYAIISSGNGIMWKCLNKIKLMYSNDAVVLSELLPLLLLQSETGYCIMYFIHIHAYIEYICSAVYAINNISQKEKDNWLITNKYFNWIGLKLLYR